MSPRRSAKPLDGPTGALAAALLMALVAASGCDQPAPDLKEWTTADHDHQTEPKKRRRRATTHRKPSSKNQLIAVTWLNQCEECHGKRGRGDGPKGPMVKARDLTDPSVQTMLSDEAMTQVIKEGRDKMPSFDLPDSTIAGLVELIRDFGERRMRRGGRSTRPAAAREGAMAQPSAPLPSGSRH